MSANVFTKEIGDKIIESVRGGNYIKVASTAAGAKYNTVLNWLRVGEGRRNDTNPPREELVLFAQELRKAEAECETTLVATLIEKLPREPKLIIEFLARRWPERWGKHDLTSVIKGDWKQTAVAMIRSGELTRDIAEQELGPELAEELFQSVGVQVSSEDV